MFSIADMAVAGAVALLLFGPDQLPKVARRAGQLVRDVQNTSQSFIREMERAADATPDVQPADPAPTIPAAPLYHETPEPAAHDVVLAEAEHSPHGEPALPRVIPAMSEGDVPTARPAGDEAFLRDSQAPPGHPAP